MSDKNDMLEKDPLKNLFRESVMEEAPESLISNVMSLIAPETALPKTRKPLISLFGWVVIGIGLSGISLLALLLTEKDAGSGYLAPLSAWYENLSFPSSDLHVPSAVFSNFPETVWLGALAFGVYGLLQLFWMKRELDRQRLF